MADETDNGTAQEDSKPDSTQAALTETTMELPDILGSVDRFSYANHMRIGASKHDVRIAFGDINAISHQVSGVIGIVMSHEHAREVSRAFANLLAKLEETKSGDEPE